VTLSLSRTEGMAHIHIQDKGVGMDEETLRRSTQRFYRKDDAHSTAGFGLGLPIAKLVVEQHGGQLTLLSLPGQGTTATLSLPTAPQTDTAPLSPNDIPPDTQPKRPPGFLDDLSGGKKVPA
jgi:two-component system sensor histidine kinase SenX3